MDTVGDIIKRLRGARSQASLGEAIGRHQSWVNKVETGKHGCNGEDFGAICDVCEASDEDRAAGMRAIAQRAGLTVADLLLAVG